MSEALFLRVVELSLDAGWLVLVLLLLRPLLRRLPRRTMCLLWGLVGLRLLCPLRIESGLSLQPNLTPLLQSGDLSSASALVLPNCLVSQSVNTSILLGESSRIVTHYYYNVGVKTIIEGAAAPLVLPELLSGIWLAGMAALLLYAALSWLQLRRQVAASLPLEGNVRLCDDIPSAFVLGLLHPRIYLPSGLEPEKRDLVLRHERCHIRRGDPWWKLLAQLLLAVYWFHPLLWAAYFLLCRDIELACDERVIRDMAQPQRAAYSQALLDCGQRRRQLSLYPLSFGRVGVKQRVHAVLRYRRPGRWLSVAALGLCVLLSLGFLTEPGDHNTYFLDSNGNICCLGLIQTDQVVMTGISIERGRELRCEMQLMSGLNGAELIELLTNSSCTFGRVGLEADGDDRQLRYSRTSSEWSGYPYDDYPISQVTLYSADGQQCAVFCRQEQRLLLDESSSDAAFADWVVAELGF